ncbi:MAG: histidine--tRNA ligase [Planctomycetota bacterium]
MLSAPLVGMARWPQAGGDACPLHQGRESMRVQALRGFRDYLPAEMLSRDRMLAIVRRVFESYGYPPLQTPALEYSEVLAGKYGEEGEMLMYRFRDHGDRDVCLRYDLTVPLARVVAEHGSLPMPFRRYQIAPVWRAEKPARGRFREFMQCDVDLVGVDDASADAEMILVDIAVLRSLGIEGFQVRVNHRGLLSALTRSLGIEPGERESAFLRLLDKLPKMGEERFSAELEKELGLAAAERARLLSTVRSGGDPAGAIDALARELDTDSGGRSALERLRQVVERVQAAGEAGRLRIDASIARGLSYYTGIIYETLLDDLPEYGSVMSGGRYDRLVGVFTGRELPAVGISFGVDRFFSALEEIGLVDKTGNPARVLVVQVAEQGFRAAFAIADRFRRAGIPTLLYPAPARLKKQFQHADTLGIPFTAVVGEAEEARGTVSLKEMATGIQVEVPVEEAIARLRGEAAGPSSG